jgi:hypothetical protein
MLASGILAKRITIILRAEKIKEVRVGLGLMAVELDSGPIGVTYVLRIKIF